MSHWISIKDQKPEEGRKLFYFFPFLGVYYGEYKSVAYPEEMFEDGTEPVYGDCFFGAKGFLTDDVTHWMYAPEDWEEIEGYPDVPEGYILLTDGKFKEWVREDETVLIKKDEYEQLKWQVKYYEAGHKMGLVCPEHTHMHIYHDDEKDGYWCHACKKAYDTFEVENDTYKYQSKFTRPCPNCNPHEEDSGDWYRAGFLEFNQGSEPYSTQHYQCTDCDSTYNIGVNGEII